MTEQKSPILKRAIEEYFPIVEINRLAVPERNAFKPIYQMHKWFARRASCVFRAILLGAMKPAGTDIMADFYKDHTDDPDTNGKVVLDPFMGGGTTVVEALRLGCKVIGIDLNPVAWFIVKTEVEPVEIEALEDAFERLANRRVSWSGKPVRETLLDQYKTECPCCGAGREVADIIYTFWVKSGICTNPECQRQVPLFQDYVISKKTPSIRYWRDASCPRCGKSFDWEVDPAALIAEPTLMVNNPLDAAGAGRGNKRWAYAPKPPVSCPWCRQEATPQPKDHKPLRKKVDLTVLLCPFCEAVWQYRGTVPAQVTCPVCAEAYSVEAERRIGYYDGDKRAFVCSCGTPAGILDSVRKWLQEGELLPTRPYAVEGWCPRCAGDSGEEDEEEAENLFGEGKPVRNKKKREPDHPCLLTKNHGKFYKRMTAADLSRYQKACTAWDMERIRLPFPKSKIPDGQETHRLLEHHYLYWSQLFNSRQLLCLSTLLKAIDEEPEQRLKEMLLCTFSSALEANNTFTRNRSSRNSPGGTAPGGIFARHDFQPKSTFCEQNVWGTGISGTNTFVQRRDILFNGMTFRHAFLDYGSPEPRDPVRNGADIRASSSVTLLIGDSSVDLVVTDPPYAGNVNYAELMDYFYVWDRLLLAPTHSVFAPEETPKAEEIIENATRGKRTEDFEQGLTSIFRGCHRVLRDKGLLIFTFHHNEELAWEALLRSVCNSGFEIIGVFPVHGEAENSMHLMGTEGIAYDLIHVCRKRDPDAAIEPRSWAGIRQEIRRSARQEIAQIEAGRYGGEPLSPADVRIVLIGKCLELYSRHYGAVIAEDADGGRRPLGLRQALEEIRMMVDQLVTRDQPLPHELQDLDPESYIYLTTLCAAQREVKGDEVHKATRGVLEVERLREAGLIIKGRTGRGRTYEVKTPHQRLNDILAKTGDASWPVQAPLTGMPVVDHDRLLFVDKLHLLIALADSGTNLTPWLERFRGDAPQIRAACEYLVQRRRDFAPALERILKLMDLGPLFRGS